MTSGAMAAPPSGGGFPQLAEAPLTQQFTVETTNYAVNLPATVSAGDLLLLLVAVDDAPAITGPGGWQQLYSSNYGNFGAGAAWAKVADGSEGGAQATVTLDAAQSGCAQVYRIAAGTWNGSLANIGLSAVQVYSTSEDLPDVLTGTSPLGSGQNLFIATLHAADDDEVPTGIPANYGDQVTVVSGSPPPGPGAGNSGATLVTCRRELEAASDDPGTFVFTTGEACLTCLIVVPPA